MNRTTFNRIKFIVEAALLLSITIIIVVSLINLFKVPSPIYFKKYVVEKGDTLWSIASLSNGYDKMDTREIVEAIEQKNNTSATIFPGQIIYIPMYED